MSKQPTPILLLAVGAIAFVAGAAAAAALFLDWRAALLVLGAAVLVLWCAYMASRSSSIPRGRAGRPVRAAARPKEAPVAGADNATGGAKRAAAGAEGAKAGSGQRGAASQGKKGAAVPAVGTRDRVSRFAKLQDDVTFLLSDLKTQITCESLGQYADPMAEGNYKYYKDFFKDKTVSYFLPNPTVQTAYTSGDHMSSPLRKPTGDVVRDEQYVICEIMRYLQGNRQNAVRKGKGMNPLDFRSSISVRQGHLSYTYVYSYTFKTEACYDGGVCSIAGEEEIPAKFIAVELVSEVDYNKYREEACTAGETYADDRKRFGYDSNLAFETETEVYMRDSHTLYLYKPFGMKECLKIKL